MPRTRVLLVIIGCVMALGAGAWVAQAAAGAVPAPIAEVAVNYANGLATGNVSQAWNLLSAQSQKGMSAAQWQQEFEQRPPSRKPPAASLLRAIAGFETAVQIEGVLVRPDEALIAVRSGVQVTQTFVLVREQGGWRVDLKASDDLNSRQAVENFLGAVRQESGGGVRPRSPQDAQMTVLRSMLAAEARDYKTSEAEVEGDRARVTVVAEIPVNLVLRATRSGPGWAVDLSRPVLPIDYSAPDPLKQAAAAADRMVCEEQLTQVARALQMYAASSDGMLPDPARWLDQVRPYLPDPPKLHCPSDPAPGVSYAMNRNLAGKRLNQIANPALTVLVYESTLHTDNPADAGQSWPTTLRHADGDLVAYADGSVRAVPLRPPFTVKEGPPGAGRIAIPGRPGAPTTRMPIQIQPRPAR
jgi:hypothetical protein